MKRSNFLHKTTRLMISLLVSAILASATIATPLTAFAQSLGNNPINDNSGFEVVYLKDNPPGAITFGDCNHYLADGYDAFKNHACYAALAYWNAWRVCQGRNDPPPLCRG